MPRFLAEDEVGFDAVTLGYPKIGGCMAFGVLTNTGLYGIHITPGNKAKASGLLTFIQNHDPNAAMLKIYGTCYWDNRYNGRGINAWKDEMRDIAALLNFTGPARGYDLSSFASYADKSHQGQSHSGVNYVEYRRNAQNDTCKIYYKKMNKMTTAKGVMNLGDPIQKVNPDKANPGTFQLNNPYLNKVVQSAQIIQTTGNQGQLHEAGFFGKHSFDI